MEIFFTVTFDQVSVSLLNKSVHFFFTKKKSLTDPKILNASVWKKIWKDRKNQVPVFLESRSNAA